MPGEHTPFSSLRVAIPGVKSQPGQGAAQRRKAFVRLANKRVTAAIDAITLIGNLSNKKNYRYLASDIEAIEAALHASVERTMVYFRSPRTELPSFHLPEEENEEEGC